MFDLETITQQFAAHRFKVTRQRRAVLGAIAESRSRMNPAEVYRRARRACPDLGLATVYRTLELLADLGVVRRVHLDDGCEAFAPTTVAHSHYLICDSCQTTIEFEDCNLSQLLNRIADQTGFTIEQHWLELVGRCPKCQKKLHGKS
jgi:Fur family ferric uptake transcriptional regulator